MSVPARLRTAHAYDHGPAQRHGGSRKRLTQQVQRQGRTDGVSLSVCADSQRDARTQQKKDKKIQKKKKLKKEKVTDHICTKLANHRHCYNNVKQGKCVDLRSGVLSACPRPGLSTPRHARSTSRHVHVSVCGHEMSHVSTITGQHLVFLKFLLQCFYIFIFGKEPADTHTPHTHR